MLKLLIGGLLLLVLVVILGPKAKVDDSDIQVDIPEDLNRYLAASEAAIERRDVRKRVQWAGAIGSKTNYSIVYIHGFSATHRDLAPVIDTLARQLEANLFLTRLRAHGDDPEKFADVTANDWLQDAEEAYQIGRRLGNQVILIGISTGATLTTWINSRHPEVFAHLLLSPNFGVQDKSANLLTRPWGGLLARLVLGSHREWEPSNEKHGTYWTTRYPVNAVVQLMALVKHVKGIDLSAIPTPAKFIYTAKDDVIDIDLAKAAFQQWGTSQKELVDLKASSRHELAGDILAPEANQALLDELKEFITSLPQIR